MLRLESKLVIEAIESAAIWIVDTESLEMKILLAAQCGAHARHYLGLQERLSMLGLAPGSYDPRHGGYSKLFAFLRSLQTSEERAAAGLLTLGAASVARLGALAAFCEEKGDSDTRDFLRGELMRTSSVGWTKDGTSSSCSPRPRTARHAPGEQYTDHRASGRAARTGSHFDARSGARLASDGVRPKCCYCTSQTTTVMLSRPPRSLASSMSRLATPSRSP